jgi:diguanylate cyclase (GGDEF)-like protein
VIFTIVAVVVLFTYNESIQNRVTLQRDQVLTRLAVVRARLEREIHSRLHLEQGMVSFTAMYPQMSQDTYARFASGVIGDDDVVRSMSILKDTTITYIYPIAGNEAAAGKDIALIPGQRDSVIYVKETGNRILIGPVDLVQGGRGIISRMPIYVQSPGRVGSTSEKFYWGQASIVMDLGRLLEHAEFFKDPELSVVIWNTAENDSVVFAGDSTVLGRSPIEMTILLPGVPWSIGGIPKNGWIDPKLSYGLAILSAIISGLLAGGLVSLLVYARARLKQMAYIDSLTGLPNRKLFWDRAGRAIEFARRRKLKIAFYMFDLDDFKRVNDVYGHATGDKMLMAVADRLHTSIRAEDTIARLGGDEFSIIAILGPDASGAEVLQKRLLEMFGTPFRCGDRDLKVLASIGIGIWPDDGATPDLVLAKADVEMYKIKRRNATSK